MNIRNVYVWFWLIYFWAITGQKSAFPLILCSSAIALFDWSLLCESVGKTTWSQSSSPLSFPPVPQSSTGASCHLSPLFSLLIMLPSVSPLQIQCFDFFPKAAGVQVFVWLLWEINYFIFILWALWFIFDPHPIFLSFLLIRGLL